MARADDDSATSDHPAIATRQHGDAVVELRGLTKRYGPLVAVEGLTFELAAGTITGFLGHNGAGKSTTLRLLVGLQTPTSGEALVFGRRYGELEHPTRRVGAVLESDDFHPRRTGRNHLRALALATDIPFSRVDELLDLIELTGAADRLARTYSLGMRQRLGLAAALLGDPELLLLDEPANGLDPEGVAWLRGFLGRFAARGRTVVICSHLLAEVAQTVDQVVILNQGRLAATVRLAELSTATGSLEDIYLRVTARQAA